MELEIKDVKYLRKQLGLTQVELAQKSNVSQSMIAKIESGDIDPAFSKAQLIFKTLETLKSGHEKKAGDIMEKKIITIPLTTAVHTAIKTMRTHSISQIPVTVHDRVIGIVTESGLIDALTKKSEYVDKIMEDVPPSVSEKTSISVVINLLKFYSIVLVIEKGKVKGIITKADVLKIY